MLEFKNYVLAESLEQAYELNQKRTNRIIGGGCWIRMGRARIQTAIDLSALKLDQIIFTDEEVSIGCMCTLRQLEVSKELNEEFNNTFYEALHSIVGVQFRNSATIGGSIYRRFGFSDPLTLLLALDTQVELYKAGRVSLAQFVKMPYDKDILVAIHIKRDKRKVVYLHHRNTATDFPVLAVAVSKLNEDWKVSIGARPMRANLVEVESEMVNVEEIVNQFAFSSNRRGSSDYRKHLAKVLLERAITSLN